MKLLFTILFISTISSTFGATSLLTIDTTKNVKGDNSTPRIDLSEIEISAYRVPGQLKSIAGAVSVIPSEQLDNTALNINSSLSAVPGIVIQEGTPGTMKLTLRGIGSRYPYGTKKIKLFFGEIPMYSMEGETTFDDINPEFLNKIEVLRGPASSIHGSSLGGTIILYPARAHYNKEEYSLMSSVGSYGYLKNSISYSNGSDRNNLLLSISGIQSEGYRQNSDYRRYSFFINSNQVFKNNLSGNLIVSGSTIKSRIPSSIDSAVFVTQPRNAAANWLKTKGYEQPDRIFAGYNLRTQPAKSWDLSSSIFISSRKTEENRPFNFWNETGYLYGGRILSQHSKIIRNTTYHFAAGTNLYFEHIRNSINENVGGIGEKGALQQKGKESIYQADFFAQLEASLKRVKITGGINLNRSGFRFKDQFSADTLDQSGTYNFPLIIAPRLSLSWHLLKDLHLYSSVNKGFSMPSLTETLSPLGLINRDIKPEKAWSFEMGARVNLFANATFIDLAFYYMPVSDLIVPKRVAEDIYVGMNAGSSIHKGMEIALQQWILGKNNSVRGLTVMANLNYTINRFNFEDFTENEIDYSGKKLPGMPDQLFSGSLDLKTPIGFYSRIELNTSGKIPLNDANTGYSKSWRVINLKTGYSFSIKKLTIDSSVNIKNLTGEKYASMVVVNAPGSASVPPRYYYPGLPRWFTFSVVLKYKDDKG